MKSKAEGAFEGLGSGAFYSSPLFGVLRPPKSPKAFVC